MRLSLAVLAAALGVLPVASPAAAAPHCTIDHRITVGGEGGWDYLFVDAATHRLYVSHGAKAIVIDTHTDAIAGEIAPAPGIHGIAIATDLGLGFTSNGRDSSLTVFNAASLAVKGTIKLPARNPDAVVYDPASKRVFAFNGGSANAVAVDAATGAIAGTLPLGDKPEFAVADGKGCMWVNLEDSSAVVQFDTRTLKELARWPLAPGQGPSGLAFDAAHRRLFSVCGNKTLVVMDADAGRIVQTVPVGQGPDAVAFDAKQGLVYASNGEGTLTVIRQVDADHYEVVENAATERGARTLALDATTGTVYLATADFGPPPAPTAERPHPRAPIVPGSFRILVVKH